MDPIAHTLVGACLGEAGLKQRSRLAMPTLLLAANIPDVDAVTMLLGRDVMYGFRRGWTHGVLGMLIGPWLVVLVVFALDRALAGKRGNREAPRFWTLIALSYLAVVTHPFLDWLNNYGVRWLMPLSDRWFYGDALYIIDPWLWLALAAAAVLAWSRSKPSMTAWLVLGLAATGLVLFAPMVPTPAKVLWCVVLCAIVAARRSSSLVHRSRMMARAALSLLAIYILAMLGLTAFARSQARVFLKAKGVSAKQIMAGPVPAHSFKRDVIAVTTSGYRFLSIDFLKGEILESHPPVDRNETPAARAALLAPQVRGYSNWLRFPAFETQHSGEGYRVWIRDVRYSRSPTSIGRVHVDLNSELKPTGAELDSAE